MAVKFTFASKAWFLIRIQLGPCIFNCFFSSNFWSSKPWIWNGSGSLFSLKCQIRMNWIKIRIRIKWIRICDPGAKSARSATSPLFTCVLFVLGTLHTSACTTTFMDAPKSLKPREIELNCPTVLVSEYRYFFLQIPVFWCIADPMFIPDPESRIWFWQDPWFGSATKNLQLKKLIPKKTRSGMCSGSWIWISYCSQSRLCW